MWSVADCPLSLSPHESLLRWEGIAVTANGAKIQLVAMDDHKIRGRVLAAAVPDRALPEAAVDDFRKWRRFMGEAAS